MAMLMPELSLATVKLFLDLAMLTCGIGYYIKFRKLKKQIDEQAKKRNMKRLGRANSNLSHYHRYSKYLIEAIIILCFLAFTVRIFLKDLFFNLIEIDGLYLRTCRCNHEINNIYIMQALAFDCFDFFVAMFILFQVNKDARLVAKTLNPYQQDNNLIDYESGSEDMRRDTLLSDPAIAGMANDVNNSQGGMRTADDLMSVVTGNNDN